MILFFLLIICFAPLEFNSDCCHSRSGSPKKEVKEETPAIKQELWWDQISAGNPQKTDFFKTLGGNNQGLWLPCSLWRRPPLKTRNNHHPRRSQVREVGRSDLVPAQQLLHGVDLLRSWTASIVLIARCVWWGSLEIVVYQHIYNLVEFCRTC